MNTQQNKEIWCSHPIIKTMQASNLGRVRSLKRPDFIPRTRIDYCGYERLNVRHEGKLITVRIHTLVIESFKGLLEKGETVDHKDSNKRNNRLDNLQKVSAERNTSLDFLRRNRTKICHPVVLDGVKYFSKREAERRTGTPRSTLKGESK